MADVFPSLLEKARLGDGLARDTVYRLAFFRLRGIASALLRRERPGHTLQPTALVSELFLKLQRLETRILNEDHFFRISARAMRQVLIDHSRSKKPPKVAIETIPELLLNGSQQTVSTESLLAVRMVFEKLRAMDPKVAETVWLRSVEGLTVHELSCTQDREVWRVRADYDFGVQWMSNQLKRFDTRATAS
jgi:RNA polymerase sigma-70 factor (ECF subfamily)